MGDGNLNGLHVQLFGKINGLADALAAFTGQSQDKVAMHHQTQFLGVFGELAGTFHGCALLDVLENLRIAGLIAHDQQAATGFALGLQGLVIGGDARSAGPRHVQGLQLRAQFNSARLLDVEGVIVKEEFLHPRPVFFGLRHLTGDGITGTLAPRMSAERLWPQAEGALGWTAARGIE